VNNPNRGGYAQFPAHLQTIAAEIETRLKGRGLDSRAHLEETKARIKAALEASLERSL
jgi:ElaB/YqjD/DUF883 family membrane-anchored ribosome-binding protein